MMLTAPRSSVPVVIESHPRLAHLFLTQSLKTLFLAFFLILLSRHPSRAENSDIEAITRRMKLISSRSTALIKELQSLRLKRRSSMRAIDEVGRSLRSVAIRNDTLRAELETHQQVLSAARDEEKELIREIAVLTEEVQKRLRALYMARKGGAEDLLVFNQHDRQMPLFSQRDITMWRKVFGSDQQLFDLLEKKRKELLSRRERLDREQATLLALEAAAEKQAIELGQKRKEHSIASARNEAYEMRIAQSLNMLRQEWSRLEGIVYRLTGGSTSTRYLRNIRVPSLAISEAPQLTNQRSTTTQPISLPAIGRVVRPFGKRRVQEFDDVIASNGVELSVEEGGGVKAIRDGTVRFVGDMPHFGPIVVVDHGDRLYSLYGRLKEVSVTVGTTLKQGHRIGSVGKLTDRGSNFYFESRRAGQAIDPIGELGVPWG